MTTKKSFADKLKDLIWGEPIPVFTADDRETVQNMDGKLNDLLAHLKAQPPTAQQATYPPAEQSGPPPPGEVDGGLADQVRKLAKTQFKANALQEETLDNLQKAIERQDNQLAELAGQRRQAVEAAQEEMIKSLLPVLDALDAAFDSGRRQVLKLPMPVATRKAMIAWLDGVRLARLRMLDVLKAYGVTPIPTIGEVFDPHRHVAVATSDADQDADGTIVAEDRRGYATPAKVLRFAEVVVARSK
jgi:molecular chaperone GrpE